MAKIVWRVPVAGLAIALGIALPDQDGIATVRGEARAASASAVFSGSTPCDPPIRALLGIAGHADAHLMEWKLTLHQPASPGASAAYHLAVRYGVGVPGRPGLAPAAAALERRGTWTSATRRTPTATRVVYSLSGTVALSSISDDVLHLLDAQGNLMIGNGGWSYTLTREDRAEQRLDPMLASAGAEPRMLSPLASGPSVYGVFEGRTPCQGIARRLNLVAPRGCAKVKWRVTLFQDPETRTATRYKIESGLLRSGAREGEWAIVRGINADPKAVAYRLNAAADEPTLVLLRGDDNVLFFLDDRLQPLAGHWEFSYTLNRRVER